MIRLGMRTLPLLTAILALGCDSTRPGKIVATYALQSVDGETLPKVVQTTPVRVEWIAERIMLYDDGGFVERSEYLEGIGSGSKTTTIDSRGRWEGDRSRFDLHYKVPEFFWGLRQCVRSGETVTCNNGIIGSPVWIYREETPTEG